MSSPPALVSSLSNPTIKALRRLHLRKERTQRGLFLAEGIRLVAEAVQCGAPIEQLIVAPDLLRSAFAYDLVAAQQQAGVPCLAVTPPVFKSLSGKDGPQGLAAVLRQQWLAPEDACALGGTWVALEAVRDPGNLGAIVRTSDAVGNAGVLLLGATTDPYDPAAVRASMGALFGQRLVRLELAQLAAWQQAGYMLVGSSDAATQDYQAVRYQPPLVLLLGSERAGLSAAQQAACDIVVRIPMVGRSDSLNLAVAAGVLLYELFNQQRHAQP